MEDSDRVCGPEAACGLKEVLARGLLGDSALLTETVAKRFTLNEFGDQVVPVTRLPKLVRPGHVRVVHSGEALDSILDRFHERGV